MSESIYAPPEADVVPPPTGGPRYYVVSPMKFVLLTILTEGMYLIYWFYRNWRQIKVADNDSLWPVPRAIFNIFYTHSLLADIDASFVTQGKTYDWRPTLIATTFVVLALIAAVSGQVSNVLSIPVWFFVSILVWPVLYAAILSPAQKAINAASDDIGGTGNSRFTTANLLWMLLGCLYWALNIFLVYNLFLIQA